MDKGLNPERISALDSETRRKILEQLEEEMTGSEVAETLGISRQKAHYHLSKLEDSGLAEKSGREYRKNFSRAIYGERPEPGIMEGMPERGLIVPGSPDQHGPDQVRARDGHLSASIGRKIGELGLDYRPVLDTKVERDDRYGEALVILGGINTNTVTRKLNEEFPAYFSGDSFPYREIETPEDSYRDPETGLLARSDDRVLVAGIRKRGTVAAVKAFKSEEVEKDYLVVKGLDLDGDGEIDDYEVVE